MNFTSKTLGLAALGSLLAGFLIGFVPEHIAKARVEDQVMALKSQGDTNQNSLHHTENQLALNQFAVQAALVSADANANNYADASTQASNLFTGLRNYVDSASDNAARQTVTEVLSVRDPTIAGLAKADPATRSELVQIFRKLQTLSSQTAR
jgi:uncharacterized membrane-anchored protein YhcB (DUF1043 family)